jgi:hypothetical protein
VGTVYGPEVQFNTPTTATLTATISSTITSYTAILGGVLSSTGGATTTIGINYTTNADFTGTYSTTTINSNAVAGTYTTTISGLTASTNYIVRTFATNSAGTSYGPTISFSTPVAPLVVGDVSGGGIVYYILKSGDNGYDANVQHGLIIPFNTISRQSTNPLPAIIETQIALNSNIISGAQYDGTLVGKANTDAIIANQGLVGTYAALYCRNYINPTSKTFNSVTYTFPQYNDWYLPSLAEINLFRTYLYATHYSKGNFFNYGNNLTYYLGVSGNGNDYAWGKYLTSTVGTDGNNGKYANNYVEGNGISWLTYNGGGTESDRLVVMPIRAF